jgi:protein-disulfide isomerase
MSKRQEIRSRRQRERGRNRLIVILLVAAGAVLIVFALIRPSLGLTNAATVQVTPITPRTFTAQVDGVHLGDPNAKVKMDVWEDFQCSGCLSYTQNLENQVLQTFVDTGHVYYTFHFFPFIDNGAADGESHLAANAAMCANAQGRFWDYHDILFANWLGENAGSYTEARLTAFAKSIGLDMTAFTQCYQAKTYSAQIEQDYQAGVQKGVPPTPGIFVNGKIVVNSTSANYIASFDDISRAINAALAGN